MADRTVVLFVFPDKSSEQFYNGPIPRTGERVTFTSTGDAGLFEPCDINSEWVVDDVEHRYGTRGLAYVRILLVSPSGRDDA